MLPGKEIIKKALCKYNAALLKQDRSMQCRGYMKQKATEA